MTMQNESIFGLRGFDRLFSGNLTPCRISHSGRRFFHPQFLVERRVFSMPPSACAIFAQKPEPDCGTISGLHAPKPQTAVLAMAVAG